MLQFTEIASGLQFPEGPVAMPDGSVLLVEIRRGTLSRVLPGGRVEVVAEPGGGPNGAAIGPDGRCYICNNGGFEWTEVNGDWYPGHQAADYAGGRIEAVDLQTGAVQTLYTHCGGEPLKGPNDIVFDRHGGFYFTDLGKSRHRDMDHGGVYYARADGSLIRELLFPLATPNGIGLSPAGDRLYVALTTTCRLLGYDVVAPGEIRKVTDGEAMLAGCANFQMFDSLAVDGAGNICVATLINGGITIIPPEGGTPRHVPVPDPMTTNICFGGADLRTAYITASMSGRLLACEWETPGLALNFPQR